MIPLFSFKLSHCAIIWYRSPDRKGFFLISSLSLIQCILIILPQFFSVLLPLYYLPKFVSLFLIFKDQFVLPKYSWMCGLPLNSNQLIKVFLRKIPSCLFPFSQQLAVSNSTKSWPPPLFTMGFSLTWVCTGLLHAITTTGRSFVQLPCCVQKISFLIDIYYLRPLQSFCPLFHHDSWALEERDIGYMFL